jgi:hypothetical protein
MTDENNGIIYSNLNTKGGVCCVPLCSVASYGGGGDINGYDEPNLGFMTCHYALLSFGIGESTSLTAPGPISLPDGGTKSYPWKSGFPEALSGYSYWRWFYSFYRIEFQSSCPLYADPNYSPPAGLPGSYQAEQLFSSITKWALFACVNGSLVDITTDALDTSEMVSQPQPPEPDPCNNYGLATNILDQNQSRSFFVSGTGDVFTDGPLSGCYLGWFEGGTYTAPSRPLVNVNGDTFMFPGKRPPLPNEQGAQGITYSCNGTIGRSGCEDGGVLSPEGVPLGIWHSGEDCSIFDCNI